VLERDTGDKLYHDILEQVLFLVAHLVLVFAPV
jgi:hypothetical protein